MKKVMLFTILISSIFLVISCDYQKIPRDPEIMINKIGPHWLVLTPLDINREIALGENAFMFINKNDTGYWHLIEHNGATGIVYDEERLIHLPKSTLFLVSDILKDVDKSLFLSLIRNDKLSLLVDAYRHPQEKILIDTFSYVKYDPEYLYLKLTTHKITNNIFYQPAGKVINQERLDTPKTGITWELLAMVISLMAGTMFICFSKKFDQNSWFSKGLPIASLVNVPFILFYMIRMALVRDESILGMTILALLLSIFFGLISILSGLVFQRISIPGFLKKYKFSIIFSLIFSNTIMIWMLLALFDRSGLLILLLPILVVVVTVALKRVWLKVYETLYVINWITKLLIFRRL